MTSAAQQHQFQPTRWRQVAVVALFAAYCCCMLRLSHNDRIPLILSGSVQHAQAAGASKGGSPVFSGLKGREPDDARHVSRVLKLVAISATVPVSRADPHSSARVGSGCDVDWDASATLTRSWLDGLEKLVSEVSTADSLFLHLDPAPGACWQRGGGRHKAAECACQLFHGAWACLALLRAASNQWQPSSPWGSVHLVPGGLCASFALFQHASHSVSELQLNTTEMSDRAVLDEVLQLLAGERTTAPLFSRDVEFAFATPRSISGFLRPLDVADTSRPVRLLSLPDPAMSHSGTTLLHPSYKAISTLPTVAVLAYHPTSRASARRCSATSHEPVDGADHPTADAAPASPASCDAQRWLDFERPFADAGSLPLVCLFVDDEEDEDISDEDWNAEAREAGSSPATTIRTNFFALPALYVGIPVLPRARKTATAARLQQEQHPVVLFHPPRVVEVSPGSVDAVPIW